MTVGNVKPFLTTKPSEIQPKGQNPALTYNLGKKLDDQNAKTGSQFSVQKEKSSAAAGLILDLIV